VAGGDRPLDQPRRQPPCPHRGRLALDRLTEQVGEGGQHRQAAQVDRPPPVTDGDLVGEPTQGMRQAGVV
jgi:hypothetical protein